MYRSTEVFDLNLSTLIVCEESLGKLPHLEAIVANCADLNYVGSAQRLNAKERITELHPKVVWIELAPDPEAGLNLLSELKQLFPETHYLVGNEVLDGVLVKSAMSKGAVDFLDDKSVVNQLPDVIARVAAKEIAHKQAMDKLEAQREQMRHMREKKMSEDMTRANASVSHMRETSNKMESQGAMNVVLLIVMVAIAIGGAVYYMMMPK